MSSCEPDRASDELILEALHLRDVEGLNGTQIARRLGLTRSGIAGTFYRVRQAEAELLRRATARGELHLMANRDGTMEPRWWAPKVPA